MKNALLLLFVFCLIACRKESEIVSELEGWNNTTLVDSDPDALVPNMYLSQLQVDQPENVKVTVFRYPFDSDKDLAKLDVEQNAHLLSPSKEFIAEVYFIKDGKPSSNFTGEGTIHIALQRGVLSVIHIESITSHKYNILTAKIPKL